VLRLLGELGAFAAAGALLGLFLLYVIAPSTPGGSALLVLTCVLFGIVVRGIFQSFRKKTDNSPSTTRKLNQTGPKSETETPPDRTG
jgi:hypothetical protein